MGYALQNQLEVSLYINDVEYPLDSNNVLDFLHIGSSTKAKLPTIHLGLTDQLHALDLLDLQDAIPLRVAIKGYGAPTVSYAFRKFNSKRQFNGMCYVYQVDGYWDSPLFWAGTSVGGIRGTSDSVLSQIASTCGLKYDGTALAADSQLWMPRNRTYAAFAKRIASRGYVSDASYMTTCVDLTGTLLYKDINNLPQSQFTVIANQLADGMYTAIDYAAVASSGLTNQVTGYNYTHYGQSMIAEDQHTAYDTLQFTSDSRSPLFNTTMKQQSERGMMTYAPIDVGNTHDAYEKARYQNQRFAGLYTMDVEFLMTQPTTLDLLKTFTFSAVDENDKKDTANSGDYTVSGRAIMVRGTVYGEKVVGTRNGTNANYVTG